jgi:hypothetical protein
VGGASGRLRPVPKHYLNAHMFRGCMHKSRLKFCVFVSCITCMQDNCGPVYLTVGESALLYRLYCATDCATSSTAVPHAAW